MDPITQQVVLAAAGAAGSGDATYVDDVFSTFLYNGTGSAQTITNGIDLSGEGGLVWAKVRNSTIHHHLVDTERGGSKYIRSSQSTPEGTDTTMITSFNSDGFTIGSSVYFSQSPRPYCTWTFRKAPGFFDVVTYTGNGTSGRTISHNLGSVPGMIIVKNLHDTGYSWAVWHRSLGSNGYLFLNSDNPENSNSAYFPSQPTASNFIVGTSGLVNIDGDSYVAYIFAHDDQSFGTDSDEAIIKCGSYTGNGSGNGPVVNLGFEPQFLLTKKTSSGDNGYWTLLDNMRGINADGNAARLYPNTSDSESDATVLSLTSTGFQLKTAGNSYNANGATYIYMAIRRPHKPPTAGTEVFGISSHFTGDNSNTRAITTGGVTADLVIQPITSGMGTCWTNRLLGGNSMVMTSDNGDANSYWTLSGWYEFTMDGYKIGGTKYLYSNSNNVNYIAYGLKRAPGFMDLVAYTGNGADNHQVSHNLGVVPEFALFKERNSTDSWVQFNDMNASTYTYGFFTSGDSGTQSYGSGFRMFAQPNATTLFLSDYAAMNQSSQKYIVYLFATLDGISKVGSYSGSSGNVDVDCGFTAGARFILIKRTNGTGDWYVWDSTRGIVSGNDPYLLMNTTAAQVTNTDYVDPLNAGFTVTSSAPAALNTSGGTYLFLAIA